MISTKNKEEYGDIGQTENIDSNTNEKNYWKKLQEPVSKMQLINESWVHIKIPQDGEVGIIIPIHKTGDKIKCENYRKSHCWALLQRFTKQYW